jgi:8-oxo-dGTP pyrophosphatase MutT (NUDIX family)
MPNVISVLRAVIEVPGKGVLLVQRSDNDSYAPGLWEFPGGKVEPGETLGRCLRREVRQETDLTGVSFGDLRALMTTAETAELEEYRGWTIVTQYFLGSKKNIEKIILNEKEHQDYCFANEIRSLANLKLRKNMFEVLTLCQGRSIF